VDTVRIRAIRTAAGYRLRTLDSKIAREHSQDAEPKVLVA